MAVLSLSELKKLQLFPDPLPNAVKFAPPFSIVLPVISITFETPFINFNDTSSDKRRCPRRKSPGSSTTKTRVLTPRVLKRLLARPRTLSGYSSGTRRTSRYYWSRCWTRNLIDADDPAIFIALPSKRQTCPYSRQKPSPSLDEIKHLHTWILLEHVTPWERFFGDIVDDKNFSTVWALNT